VLYYSAVPLRVSTTPLEPVHNHSVAPRTQLALSHNTRISACTLIMTNAISAAGAIVGLVMPVFQYAKGLTGQNQAEKAELSKVLIE